jgi:hypothetical protein
MGTEPLGNNFVFYPDDGLDPHSTPTANLPYNLMARVWFVAKVTGHYDDLGIMWHAPDTDSYIKVDWVKYDVEQGHTFTTWKSDGVVNCSYQYLPTEYWIGSGANKAVAIVDFGDDSFAFGYRWDGSSTVSDMLVAFDMSYEDSNDVWFQFIQGPSSPVRAVGYKGMRLLPAATFVSQDNGENWIFNWNPMTPLTDGMWIGYSRLFPRPPSPPDVPVP